MLARRFVLSVVTASLALTSAIVPAGAAGSAPAIAEFDAAFAKVNDYTATVRAHEVSGTDVQDRVYHYAFKRPNFAKTDIVDGAGAGSGGVWRGGTQVRGHLKIGFMTFHKQVDIHDPKATSLRGYTIPEGLLQNEVDKYKEISGELSQQSGPPVNGEATDEITLKPANPSAVHGVTRMVIYLSKATHFPVKQQRYEGDKLVAEENVSDVKTNVGLTDADFPF